MIWALPFGVMVGLVFRASIKPEALRQSVRGIYARLLEMRVYFDDPGIVWKAQRGLWIWNLRLLRTLALPLFLTGIPIFAIAWLLCPQVAGLEKTAVISAPSGSIVSGRHVEAQGKIWFETPAPLQREATWLFEFSLLVTIGAGATLFLQKPRAAAAK